VTMRPVARAAPSIAARSSGLSVCMLITPAAIPLVFNASCTLNAVLTQPPVAMRVRSVPSRIVTAAPMQNSALYHHRAEVAETDVDRPSIAAAARTAR